MGRIVGSTSQNISANRPPIHRHFAASRGARRFYSAGMQAFPVLPLLGRLARAALCTLGPSLAIALALGLAAPDARADAAAPEPTGLAPALEQQVRTLALDGSADTPPGVTRVEVVIGQIDPRLRLAPCQKVEPYLPNNTRLWGRSRIGLRCTEGRTAWNVYLPITVKAWGRGLVATSAAAAGSILRADDVAEAEVDLAEEASPALVDPNQVIGRTLAQPLKAGQSVRLGNLKARVWFSAGDTVKVVALGAGFSLEGTAQALSNGIEGQAARVRTENGHVLTGNPVGNRRVELPL